MFLFCVLLNSSDRTYVFESIDGGLEAELINVLINILMISLELFYLSNNHHFSTSLDLVSVLSTRFQEGIIIFYDLPLSGFICCWLSC